MSGAKGKQRGPHASGRRLWGFLTLVMVLGILFVSVASSRRHLATPATTTESTLRVAQQGCNNDDCEQGVVYHAPGFIVMEARRDLGRILEKKGFRTGAEVGVQRGVNALQILRTWPSCESFSLVDLWAHQENYLDGANVNNEQQETNFQITQNNLREFTNKTTYYRMTSLEAAKHFEDKSLDFVYLDARHDYCAVLDDIQAYWPKLRPGGIMGGHDFLYSREVKAATGNQDWSVCSDGTTNQGAVRGAVEDFANEHGLVLAVEFNLNEKFKSWMFQKPTKARCANNNLGQVHQVA